MSYTPTTWATGDVVTATKLNKLEGGVASCYPSCAPLVISVEYNENDEQFLTNKTPADVESAIISGIPIVSSYDGSLQKGGRLISFKKTIDIEDSDNTSYSITVIVGGVDQTFTAQTSTDTFYSGGR